MRCGSSRRGLASIAALAAVLVLAALALQAAAFVPAVRQAAPTAAATRRIAAAVEAGACRRGATRLHSLLDDLGLGGDDEENSDFYNPENIQEGDAVEVVKDSKFYIPKAPKEGINPKGYKGTVLSLKFAAKNGVMCSANRPVVVKFTEPYKFQGHFEFRELKKL